MATTKAKVEMPVNEEGERMVKIRLPITRDDQKAVYVRVNDRTWLIPRGKEWEVPECVAEVLENAEKQQLERMEFENKVQKG